MLKCRSVFERVHGYNTVIVLFEVNIRSLTNQSRRNDSRSAVISKVGGSTLCLGTLCSGDKGYIKSKSTGLSESPYSAVQAFPKDSRIS